MDPSFKIIRVSAAEPSGSSSLQVIVQSSWILGRSEDVKMYACLKDLQSKRMGEFAVFPTSTEEIERVCTKICHLGPQHLSKNCNNSYFPSIRLKPLKIYLYMMSLIFIQIDEVWTYYAFSNCRGARQTFTNTRNSSKP